MLSSIQTLNHMFNIRISFAGYVSNEHCTSLDKSLEAGFCFCSLPGRRKTQSRILLRVGLVQSVDASHANTELNHESDVREQHPHHMSITAHMGV